MVRPAIRQREIALCAGQHRGIGREKAQEPIRQRRLTEQDCFGHLSFLWVSCWFDFAGFSLQGLPAVALVPCARW